MFEIHRPLTKTLLFAVMCAGGFTGSSANANCPADECNYLDPHYEAAMAAFTRCNTRIADQFTHAMDALAIGYPRFGIAWRAKEAVRNELTSYSGDVTTPMVEEWTKRADEAQKVFEDRILRTAEPEALNLYNLWQMKLEQLWKQCGREPQPPGK